MIAAWPSPPGGDEEYALAFDRGRAIRLLILGALFDEGNKLRHFTVEVMRALDRAGIDTMLPDLPGCNESLAPLEHQTLADWRETGAAAARHFSASHVLAIRGGALVAPEGWPVLAYAPLAGSPLLQGLLRARAIAAREAGLHETRETLRARAKREGIELAGYRLGARMVQDLEAAPVADPLLAEIRQSDLDAPGLWLRAEPDHSPAQAAALAAAIGGALAV